MSFVHKYNFIAIEGNIGSGKTSLATRMARSNSLNLMLEEFSDNPLLPKFYEKVDVALHLELSFLIKRYSQIKNNPAFSDQGLIISDYYFDKSLVFAQTNLNKEELYMYNMTFNKIKAALP